MEFKVYILSTEEDLQEERIELERALSPLNNDLDGFSFTINNPRTNIESSLEEIKNCDLFIFIIAFKYSDAYETVPSSRTNLEFNQATDFNIPIIACFKDEDQSVLLSHTHHDKIELQQKLINFKKEIQKSTSRIEKYKTTYNLRTIVIEAITDLYKKRANAPKERGNIDCLVVMSYKPEPHLIDVYYVAIKDVMKEKKISVTRVDEIQHSEKITDLIPKQIKNAKIIIAVLTDATPSCHYEIGVAHALKKNVIFLNEKGRPIFYDIQDYGVILYENIKDLREKLKNRIENMEVL